MRKSNSPETTGAKKATGSKTGPAAKKQTENHAAGKNTSKAMSTKKSSGQDQSGEEGLRTLLIAQLKDIYWAEKALTKAIPKLIENASAEELVNALESHLEATNMQVKRCEEVFSALGEKAEAKTCEAMEGLIEEGDEIVSEYEEGPVRDAGIICAAQKVEHYEIATYGSLVAFAHHLGETEVAELLEETLEEEKEADELLTDIAVNGINLEAVEEINDED
jgi:ferritin-like metal-binding protein YciE